MEKITAVVRKKIKQYIKNKIDISPLIEGKIIKGEDFSYAIIKKMKREEDNISDCNFSNCLIGSDDDIVSLLRCNMKNCNFNSAKFVGRAWIRYCDARNCNFKNADVSDVDYRFSDFRDGDFCNSKITISTSAGVGCKFPVSMFEELCKGWLLNITVEETE